MDEGRGGIFPGSGYAEASQKHAKGRPEDINRRGGTGAGEEEARPKRAGYQEWRNNPPRDQKGPGPRSRSAGGREWFNNWRRKDVRERGEPTGVDRGTSIVEGIVQ